MENDWQWENLYIVLAKRVPNFDIFWLFLGCQHYGTNHVMGHISSTIYIAYLLWPLFCYPPVAAEPLRNRSGNAERDETGRRAPRFLQDFRQEERAWTYNGKESWKRLTIYIITRNVIIKRVTIYIISLQLHVYIYISYIICREYRPL